ncbi:MAG: GDP-L-fucose synthase [Chitinispirillales bacterium]|jgi:GDP-L-fucose synthase|nr:GDP-L-fucose synthase [Chitinispirillales bacterium]
MDKKAKIYIAGHKGLVGSAIWSNLVSKGYTNLVGKTRSELDLLDCVAAQKFFDDELPEYVILAAACVGGIIANNTYRADFIYQNLQIQQNIIGESFKHHVKKLLFLGSTCIYPKNAPQPMKESALLTSSLEYTNEPYAIAKIAGLKMCESFNLQYGTNYIAVMPTNLYGPQDNFHLENSHVIPGVMRKIHLAKRLMEKDFDGIRKDLTARPVNGVNGNASDSELISVLANYGIRDSAVSLWGTGSAMREFLWSEDMADACVYILERVDFTNITRATSFDNGEIRNCHINIGTGKELSIKNLTQIISQAIGYTGEICFDSSKPDGAMRKLTDVGKLHSLGWHHKIEIEEGIGRLYEWYRESNC